MGGRLLADTVVRFVNTSKLSVDSTIGLKRSVGILHERIDRVPKCSETILELGNITADVLILLVAMERDWKGRGTLIRVRTIIDEWLAVVLCCVIALEVLLISWIV